MLTVTRSLILAALAAVAVAQVPGCDRNYTVHLGDTCFSISAANNVSTFQLQNVNKVINSDCSNLALGEPLCLGVSGQDCTVTHTIGTNDNCTSIIEAAGISRQVLLANNPNVNSDCSNILTGETLCTANVVIVSGSS